MKSPTKRQREYLDFITGFAEENGYAPTLRELAAGIGIASTNGVSQQLESLRRKGCVTWVPHTARTLRVVK